MKIKDEIDLTNILAMAFSQYANKVQNGAVAPYKAFLTGENTVSVLVHLNDDGSVAVSSPVVEAIVFPEPKQEFVEISGISGMEADNTVTVSGSNLEVSGNSIKEVEEKPKSRKRKTI